ncbi:thiol-disulfide isomerase/thioredoxin [Kribbella steppae]|uniref:Thiol-disulfide isomerase/thioredoxin n=1 Tax=Kribbella steppae TaxID=2512223 RepID=A0A4R2H032_9ACTN|nr:TlpA disulfide reductase family protein [Kribbella steppae]TCO17611.1 thiol-disulfide isomerase/thioredoxin [Kribbella steppae]
MNHKLGSRTTLCLIAGLVALTGVVACGPEQAGSKQESGGSQPKASSNAVAGADQLAACPSTPSKPPVSNALPDVTLRCLGDGPDIRLADLRGPLVVNVWAQWCGPCRDEAPYLAELAKTGKVQMLGIDYADPRPELAVKFATDEGLAYPHLVDADKTIQRALKVAGPPLTAFVDKDGAVVYVHHGVLTSQQQLDQLVRDKLGVTL